MKILVFGGSFDPVHKGHVAVLKKALQVIKPDAAHVVPAYHSPFKAKSPTPFKVRMQMAKAAFAPLGKNIIFDDYELKRGGKTYSYQLVQYLRQRYDNPEIYLLVGTDCLNDLHAWKNPEYIFKHATVVAGRRKGFSEHKADFRHVFLPGTFPKMSSTRVRAHVLASGSVPTDKVPEAVAEVILKNDLYGFEVHRWLKAHLKPNRYLHSVKVAELCAVLSDIYEVPVEKAVQAGILHDAGKGFSGAEIEEVVNEALFNAYANGQKDLEMQNLLDCISATSPLSRTMAETIANLRKWAEQRARMASKDKPDEVKPLGEDVPRLQQEYSNPFIRKKN